MGSGPFNNELAAVRNYGVDDDAAAVAFCNETENESERPFHTINIIIIRVRDDIILYGRSYVVVTRLKRGRSRPY